MTTYHPSKRNKKYRGTDHDITSRSNRRKVCPTCGHSKPNANFNYSIVPTKEQEAKGIQTKKVRTKFCKDCRDEHNGRETSRPDYKRTLSSTYISHGEETLAERLEKRRGTR